MLRSVRFILSGLVLLSINAAARAEVVLGSPFVDHAVLQRGRPIRIWGTAPAGAAVKVSLGGESAGGKADAQGRWSVSLGAMTAGGPFKLVATVGGEEAAAADLLVGDVWLCAGQSNMQFAVRDAADAKAVAADAGSHGMLRLGKVSVEWKDRPQRAVKVKWAAASPESAMGFTAVGYFFADALLKAPAMKGVPVGILEADLGGTVIESWLPKSSLGGFDPKELQSSMFGIGPSLLYNGMIHPLAGTGVKGVIWYQGEGNAGEPARYTKLLPILFQTWRETFDEPTLPFLVVQLPDYATDWGGYYWQWIRESQAQAVAATPGASLVVGLGTNDGWNLHPQGKREIGRRAALLARTAVYGESVHGRPPTYKAATVQGNSVRVTFDSAGGLTSGSESVRGFQLAGADGVYRAAEGHLDGDAVVVSSPDVKQPKTVRYAFTGVPRATLTNDAGIPAAPFRTDDQPASKGHGEAQRQRAGLVYRAPDYRLTLDGAGKVSSLVVRNQQLLSNAADPWGGTSFGNRELPVVKMLGTDALFAGDNETSLRIELADTSMRWTVSNMHPKEGVKFHIALSPAVSVGGTGGAVTLKRQGATLHLTGIDRVTTVDDVAADAGKVLEVDLPPGASKVIELKLN